jgi:hypothetical protein
MGENDIENTGKAYSVETLTLSILDTSSPVLLRIDTSPTDNERAR